MSPGYISPAIVSRYENHCAAHLLFTAYCLRPSAFLQNDLPRLGFKQLGALHVEREFKRLIVSHVGL